MRISLIVALVAPLSFAGACASQILSPPARFQPFEGPPMAGPGATWLDLEGGGGGQMFGPSAGGGTARLRHGGASNEWSGEASFAYIDTDSPSTASRLWGALRGGVRGRFDRDFDHAWWGAGVGVGAYAGGVFLSPEVGLGIGWNNPYVIPYLSVTGFVSMPLAAREVDTSANDDERRSDTPLATFGVRLQLGLEIPITERAALSFGMNAVRLVDIEGADEGWAGLGGALKLEL